MALKHRGELRNLKVARPTIVAAPGALEPVLPSLRGALPDHSSPDFAPRRVALSRPA